MGIIGFTGIIGFNVILLDKGLWVIGIVGEGTGTDCGVNDTVFEIGMRVLTSWGGTRDFCSFIIGLGTVIMVDWGRTFWVCGVGIRVFWLYVMVLGAKTETLVGGFWTIDIGGGTIDFWVYVIGLITVVGGGTIDFWE